MGGKGEGGGMMPVSSEALRASTFSTLPYPYTYYPCMYIGFSEASATRTIKLRTYEHARIQTGGKEGGGLGGGMDGFAPLP